jgi:hypothetical protein
MMPPGGQQLSAYDWQGGRLTGAHSASVAMCWTGLRNSLGNFVHWPDLPKPFAPSLEIPLVCWQRTKTDFQLGNSISSRSKMRAFNRLAPTLRGPELACPIARSVPITKIASRSPTPKSCYRPDDIFIFLLTRACWLGGIELDGMGLIEGFARPRRKG